MINNPMVLIVLIVGVFLIVISAITGLVIIALHNVGVIQYIVPVIASIITGFLTAGAAIVTHFVSGVQEQQRIILDNANNKTTP